MSDMPCFVGIDVAKAQWDIALRPSGERWSVPNDTNGVTTLVERMQTLQPTLIVLEATGGLERLVTSALATAGLPVVVVHPAPGRGILPGPQASEPKQRRWMRVRWRHCADVIRPTPRPLPDAQTQELRALLGRRQHTDRHAHRGSRTVWRGPSAASPKDIAAHITWLNAGIATLDDDLETMLRASPLWRENDDLLQRAKGIGPVCARTLRAGTPRVGDAHAAADRGLGRRGAPPL